MKRPFLARGWSSVASTYAIYRIGIALHPHLLLLVWLSRFTSLSLLPLLSHCQSYIIRYTHKYKWYNDKGSVCSAFHFYNSSRTRRQGVRHLPYSGPWLFWLEQLYILKSIIHGIPVCVESELLFEKKKKTENARIGRGSLGMFQMMKKYHC